MTVGGMPQGLERQSLTMAPSASGSCRVISLQERCASPGSAFPQVDTGT
jgi:hypothetical protein